jgi:translation initiation factor IF-1
MPTPGQQKLRKTGTVTEALRAGSFRVTMDEGNEVLAHLSGKMRLYFIRITPGDKVIVEVSPYDQTRGRIVQRL